MNNDNGNVWSEGHDNDEAISIDVIDLMGQNITVILFETRRVFNEAREKGEFHGGKSFNFRLLKPALATVKKEFEVTWYFSFLSVGGLAQLTRPASSHAAWILKKLRSELAGRISKDPSLAKHPPMAKDISFSIWAYEVVNFSDERLHRFLHIIGLTVLVSRSTPTHVSMKIHQGYLRLPLLGSSYPIPAPPAEALREVTGLALKAQQNLPGRPVGLRGVLGYLVYYNKSTLRSCTTCSSGH
ncbi:hypothetical protein EV361DRAFT_873430 [Lentinula raphanica]|nr:hypothetical protein EV361DRAFT_873430 [Lentinula raphanica]